MFLRRIGNLNPFEGHDLLGYRSVMPLLVDLDNDLDFDLIVGLGVQTRSSSLFFENQGGAKDKKIMVAYTTRTGNGLNILTDTGGKDGIVEATATFADLNGNGFTDMLLNTVLYTRGADGFTKFPCEPAPVGCPSNHPLYNLRNNMNYKLLFDSNDATQPTFVDLNGDGLFDLVMASPGQLDYWENTGTRNVASFTQHQGTSELVPATFHPFGFMKPDIVYNVVVSIAFADLDGDTKTDVMVWGLSHGNPLEPPQIFLNTATNVAHPTFTRVDVIDPAPFSDPFVTSWPPNVDYDMVEPSLAIADVDMDGDFDLCVGLTNGLLHYFENVGNKNVPYFVHRVKFLHVDTTEHSDDSYLNPFRAFGANSDTGLPTGNIVRAQPVFEDLNQDGFLDLIVGSSDGTMHVLELNSCSQPYDCSFQGDCVVDKKQWFAMSVVNGICSCKPWAGGSHCQQCPAGKTEARREGGSVLVQPRAPTCNICSPGKWDKRTGAMLEVASLTSFGCIACATGKYNILSGTDSETFCLDCPQGYYQTLTGAAFCLPCRLGTSQPQKGSQSCNTCMDHTFADLAASIRCKECPFGFDALGNSKSACVNCDLGKRYLRSSKSCVACRKGQYQDARGQVLCKQCPKNTYGEKRGFSSRSDCTPCPTSRTTGKKKGGKSSQVCLCKKTEYYAKAVNASTVCLVCPVGGNCSYYDGIPLFKVGTIEGYWRSSEQSTRFHKCSRYSNATFCSGTNGTYQKNHPESQCLEGHRGPLCSLCMKGWAMLEKKCTKCVTGTESQANALASAMVGCEILLLLMLTMYFTYASSPLKKIEASDQIKAVVTSMKVKRRIHSLVATSKHQHDTNDTNEKNETKKEQRRKHNKLTN